MRSRVFNALKSSLAVLEATKLSCVRWHACARTDVPADAIPCAAGRWRWTHSHQQLGPKFSKARLDAFRLSSSLHLPGIRVFADSQLARETARRAVSHASSKCHAQAVVALSWAIWRDSVLVAGGSTSCRASDFLVQCPAIRSVAFQSVRSSRCCECSAEPLLHLPQSSARSTLFACLLLTCFGTRQSCATELRLVQGLTTVERIGWEASFQPVEVQGPG